MRYTSLLLMLLSLAGCGTASTTHLDVSSTQAPMFELVDARTAEAKLSSKSNRPEGQIVSLGDDAVQPAGPMLMQSWLSNRFQTRIQGHQLTLEEFAVEVTDPAVSVDAEGINRSANVTPGAGPLAGALAYWLIVAIEHTRSDKYVGVRISGKLGDQAFTARGDDTFKGHVTESDINAVIMQALESMAEQIDNLLLAEARAPVATTANAVTSSNKDTGEVTQ